MFKKGTKVKSIFVSKNATVYKMCIALAHPLLGIFQARFDVG
jgi:hypothetical protein